MRRWVVLLLLLGLAGCATVPEPLRNAPEQSPSIDAVRADPQAHSGDRVRWGGTIAGVENRAERTLIEVVGRPLNADGRPDKDGATPGRFLARVDGFLDPAVYEEGRLLTVVGALDEAAVRPVGDYPYRYPVVAADGYYLWPPIRYVRYQRSRRYDPFYDPWYDPWYDPFYPRWHHHRHH